MRDIIRDRAVVTSNTGLVEKNPCIQLESTLRPLDSTKLDVFGCLVWRIATRDSHFTSITGAAVDWRLPFVARFSSLILTAGLFAGLSTEIHFAQTTAWNSLVVSAAWDRAILFS